MKGSQFRFAACLLLLCGAPAMAHHGVAGVGAAALEGPGAPVESAGSAVLPEGKTLLYAKLDYAKFKSVNPADTEADSNQFWMAGLGHGFTPWLSAYVFAPYNRKIDSAEPAGAATPQFDTRGWADPSVMAQLGFKYDQGFKLVPANESLDDLEDWHFTLFGGFSIPHGKPDLKDRNGDIHPAKSTGFGTSDRSLGLTATRMLSKNLTFNSELSGIRFRSYRYQADTSYPTGRDFRFGAEDRLNLALAYRFHTNVAQKFRADFSLEAQFLRLQPDAANGLADPDSGGRVAYLLPGIRLYQDNMSFAFGIKTPVWKKLNQASGLQQGSEGTEKYRLIFSVSSLF